MKNFIIMETLFLDPVEFEIQIKKTLTVECNGKLQQRKFHCLLRNFDSRFLNAKISAWICVIIKKSDKKFFA